MKLIYTLLCAGVLLLTSCSNDNANVDSAIKTNSVKVTVPEDICSLINKEMVQQYFDVDESDLNLVLEMENYKEYTTCGYKWEKSNFKELQNIQLEKMMSMSFPEEGEGKATVSDILELESPYSLISVGKFKAFADGKKAKSRFEQSHHIPTKEEIELLKKEIDKNKELTDDQKEVGQSLSGGVAESLNFKEVTGIGDQAFYDYLNKSVDVLVSNVSFSVLIDSEKSLDENIDIAKNIAAGVINSLTK